MRTMPSYTLPMRAWAIAAPEVVVKSNDAGGAVVPTTIVCAADVAGVSTTASPTPLLAVLPAEHAASNPTNPVEKRIFAIFRMII